jgi:hypothetical protein
MSNHEKTYLPGEAFQDLADCDTGIRQIVPHYDQMPVTIARVLPGKAGAILSAQNKSPENYILSTECGLPFNTPEDNIRAAIQYA